MKLPENTTVKLSGHDNERHLFGSFGDPWCEDQDVGDAENIETGESDVTCKACLAAMKEEGYEG